MLPFCHIAGNRIGSIRIENGRPMPKPIALKSFMRFLIAFLFFFVLLFDQRLLPVFFVVVFYRKSQSRIEEKNMLYFCLGPKFQESLTSWMSSPLRLLVEFGGLTENYENFVINFFPLRIVVFAGEK